MSSIRDIKRYLEAHIEAAIRVPLRRAKDIIVGVPKHPSEYDLANTKNTALKITFDDRSYMVLYDRKDIQTWLAPNFVANTHIHVPANAVTTADVLPEINARWGLDFTASDIKDLPIEYRGNTLVLKVSDTNLWFTGEVRLPVWPREENAYVVDWEPRIAVFQNVAGDLTRELMTGSLETYTIDYSSVSAACAAMPVASGRAWANGDNTKIAALATAMRSVDGLPWVLNTNAMVAYNLVYANCLYNGPTESFSLHLPKQGIAWWTQQNDQENAYSRYDQYVNRNMRSVLVLNLNHNYGITNLNGLLFIHYGGPAVPFVETPYRDPEYYWELDGDQKSFIQGKPDLNLPVNFWPHVDGTNVPSLLASGNYPLGVSLPTASDYTLTFTLGVGWRAAAGWMGLFGDATGGNAAGAIKISNLNAISVVGASYQWFASAGVAELLYLNRVAVTITRKGRVLRTYHDGKLVSIAELPDGYVAAPITHFGKVNEMLANSFTFFRIGYFDYALSSKQVLDFKRSNYGRA